MSDKNAKPDNRGKPTSEELEQTIELARDIFVRWSGRQPPAKNITDTAFELAEEFVKTAQEYRKRHRQRSVYPGD